MSDLTLTRGDDRTIDIAANEDLTGAFLWWTAKVSRAQPDSDAIFAKHSDGGGITIDAGTAGTGIIEIDAADWPDPTPAKLQHDLQMLLSGEVTTLDSGTITVVNDVKKGITPP